MADAYVDFTNGLDSNDGLTWATAELTIQAGIDTAGSGGRCFVQIDKDNVDTSNNDTTAASTTLDFPGTDLVPFGLYGCKNGTTAEPPAASDLAIRGTTTLPVYQITGAGQDATLDETSANSAVAVFIHGIRFEATDNLVTGVRMTVYFQDCEIDCDELVPGSTGHLELSNCEVEFTQTAGGFQGRYLRMYGGLISGVGITQMVDATTVGKMLFYGVDLSTVNGTLCDMGSSEDLELRIVNCKLPTGVSRLTGVSTTGNAFVEVINSSDETGLGIGESVRDYAKQYHRGTILSEATFIRTDGANDGVAGFSYALTPNASSTKEGLLGLDTPWFGGIVVGDATTSKDFTIYVANSSGADMTNADVWVELFYPSEAGTTVHGYSNGRTIDSTPGDLTDDAVSDWSTGAGGKNAQKIVIAKTPDYTGPVYARVHFAQAGTNTLYVDPKVYVTDT